MCLIRQQGDVLGKDRLGRVSMLSHSRPVSDTTKVETGHSVGMPVCRQGTPGIDAQSKKVDYVVQTVSIPCSQGLCHDRVFFSFHEKAY